MVSKIEKAARKYVLGSIYAQLDGNFHRLHEGDAFQNKTLVFQRSGGKLSPMFDVEQKLVVIIVNMSKIHQRISPTQKLQL